MMKNEPMPNAPQQPERILLVEDEPELANIVREYVEQAGMGIDHLDNGREATEAALSGRYDLMLLDLMLPGKDGLTICREVRGSSDIPIIMLTAKVEEVDRLVGLEIGADDYICKPFSPREVVARVRVILRRAGGVAANAATAPGRVQVDAERWRITIDGKPLELTTREFRLLETLHARPGRVFSRAQLLDLAFPDDADVIDRTIDSHIKNIRSKIKATCDWEPIRSVYGVGYAFDDVSVK